MILNPSEEQVVPCNDELAFSRAWSTIVIVLSVYIYALFVYYELIFTIILSKNLSDKFLLMSDNYVSY